MLFTRHPIHPSSIWASPQSPAAEELGEVGEEEEGARLGGGASCLHVCTEGVEEVPPPLHPLHPQQAWKEKSGVYHRLQPPLAEHPSGRKRAYCCDSHSVVLSGEEEDEEERRRRRGEETTGDRWKERKKSGGEKRGARLHSLF